MCGFNFNALALLVGASHRSIEIVITITGTIFGDWPNLNKNCVSMCVTERRATERN